MTSALNRLRARAAAVLASALVHAGVFGALAWPHAPPALANVIFPEIVLVSIEASPPAAPPIAPPRQSGGAQRAPAIAGPTNLSAETAPDVAPVQTPPQAKPQATSQEEDAYARAVWTHLSAHKPKSAAGKRTARVWFALDFNGALLEARLTRHSGSAAFDAACLAAIRAAAPFPAPPAGMPKQALIFEVPINARGPAA